MKSKNLSLKTAHKVRLKAPLLLPLLLAITIPIQATLAQSPIWKTYHDMGKHMLDDGDFSGAEKNLLEAISEAEKLPQSQNMLKQSLGLLELTYRKLGQNEDAEKIASRIKILNSANAGAETQSSTGKAIAPPTENPAAASSNGTAA
ncbi:MAG: hypothetical protein K2X27_22180, partial [Candidatus Obscuribacterales bacterium]|nr:hypothetical protein [Candidatus Obscuribacterales bacterium]